MLKFSQTGYQSTTIDRHSYTKKSTTSNTSKELIKTNNLDNKYAGLKIDGSLMKFKNIPNSNPRSKTRPISEYATRDKRHFEHSTRIRSNRNKIPKIESQYNYEHLIQIHESSVRKSRDKENISKKSKQLDDSVFYNFSVENECLLNKTTNQQKKEPIHENKLLESLYDISDKETLQHQSFGKNTENLIECEKNSIQYCTKWKKHPKIISKNISKNSSAQKLDELLNHSRGESIDSYRDNQLKRSIDLKRKSEHKNENISKNKETTNFYNSKSITNKNTLDEQENNDRIVNSLRKSVSKKYPQNEEKVIDKINAFLKKNTLVDNNFSSINISNFGKTTGETSLGTVVKFKNRFHSASVPQQLEIFGVSNVGNNSKHNTLTKKKKNIGGVKYPNIDKKPVFGLDSQSDYDKSLNDLSNWKSNYDIGILRGKVNNIKSSKFDSRSIDNIGIEKSENILGSYEQTTSNPEKKSSSLYKGPYVNKTTLFKISQLPNEENYKTSGTIENENLHRKIEFDPEWDKGIIVEENLSMEQYNNLNNKQVEEYYMVQDNIKRLNEIETDNDAIKRNAECFKTGIHPKYTKKMKHENANKNPKIKLSCLNISNNQKQKVKKNNNKICHDRTKSADVKPSSEIQKWCFDRYQIQLNEEKKEILENKQNINNKENIQIKEFDQTNFDLKESSMNNSPCDSPKFNRKKVLDTENSQLDSSISDEDNYQEKDVVATENSNPQAPEKNNENLAAIRISNRLLYVLEENNMNTSDRKINVHLNDQKGFTKSGLKNEILITEDRESQSSLDIHLSPKQVEVKENAHDDKVHSNIINEGYFKKNCTFGEKLNEHRMNNDYSSQRHIEASSNRIINPKPKMQFKILTSKDSTTKNSMRDVLNSNIEKIQHNNMIKQSARSIDVQGQPNEMRKSTANSVEKPVQNIEVHSRRDICNKKLIENEKINSKYKQPPHILEFFKNEETNTIIQDSQIKYRTMALEKINDFKKSVDDKKKNSYYSIWDDEQNKSLAQVFVREEVNELISNVNKNTDKNDEKTNDYMDKIYKPFEDLLHTFQYHTDYLNLLGDDLTRQNDEVKLAVKKHCEKKTEESYLEIENNKKDLVYENLLEDAVGLVVKSTEKEQENLKNINLSIPAKKEGSLYSKERSTERNRRDSVFNKQRKNNLQKALTIKKTDNQNTDTTSLSKNSKNTEKSVNKKQTQIKNLESCTKKDIGSRKITNTAKTNKNVLNYGTKPKMVSLEVTDRIAEELEEDTIRNQDTQLEQTSPSRDASMLILKNSKPSKRENINEIINIVNQSNNILKSMSYEKQKQKISNFKVEKEIFAKKKVITNTLTSDQSIEKSPKASKGILNSSKKKIKESRNEQSSKKSHKLSENSFETPKKKVLDFSDPILEKTFKYGRSGKTLDVPRIDFEGQSFVDRSHSRNNIFDKISEKKIKTSARSMINGNSSNNNRKLSGILKFSELSNKREVENKILSTDRHSTN